MSTPKRAIKLARVSTERQAKLYSLDYQLDQEQEYCDEVGLVVVAEFWPSSLQTEQQRNTLSWSSHYL